MDTCGQERFESLISIYYKEADCCLLVYDISSEKSFEKIKKHYIKKIKDNCNNIKKVVLLGNKTDLENERKISKEEGVKLALNNGYIFMETSCKDNYNVSDAFTTLIEMTNREILKKGKNSSFRILNNSFKQERIENKSSSCC